MPPKQQSYLQLQIGKMWTLPWVAPGTDQPDGTHKYSLPRKDMNVTVSGVQIKAGLALGSWVAFKSTTPGNSMVMGRPRPCGR